MKVDIISIAGKSHINIIMKAAPEVRLRRVCANKWKPDVVDVVFDSLRHKVWVEAA